VPQFFRILVVEDFEPFRRFIRTALLARPEFRVVGEAVDGVEAVEKAKDLQPDVVLLDIGLPKLNGMAAAEQICILAPDAKLLFISLEASSAIVEEAFRLGARGYIHKLKAQDDLIPAMEAVLAGKQFVSDNLEYSKSAKVNLRHELQFSSDDTVFLESATHFIAEPLKAGGAAIVVATSTHREGLVQSLRAAAFDIDNAIQQGTYVSLDTSEVLSNIMVNGLPDRRRLFDMMGSVIESSIKATKKAHPRVAAFGECAPLLWAKGNTNAAVQIEKICNDLLRMYDVDVLCGYPPSASLRADDEAAFKSICAEHTAVFSR